MKLMTCILANEKPLYPELDFKLREAHDTCYKLLLRPNVPNSGVTTRLLSQIIDSKDIPLLSKIINN